MRHARLTLPLPIGPLALAVILLSYRRGLVSAARGPHLLLSHSPPASIAAITLVDRIFPKHFAAAEGPHRVQSPAATDFGNAAAGNMPEMRSLPRFAEQR